MLYKLYYLLLNFEGVLKYNDEDFLITSTKLMIYLYI